MSETSESPLEAFKRSTAATLKAIAANADLRVIFTPGPPQITREEVRLPAPSPQMNAEEVIRLRGQADSLALKLRHHTDRLHSRAMPAGHDARRVWEAVEQARIEAVGIRRLAGVQDNIAAALDQQCRAENLDKAKSKDDIPLAEAMRLLAREKFTGLPSPASAAQALAFWRADVERLAGPILDKLAQQITDEAAFVQNLTRLMVDMDLMQPNEATDGDSDDESPAGDTPDGGGDGDQDSSGGADGEGEEQLADDQQTSGDGTGDDSASGETPEEGDDRHQMGQGSDEPGGPSPRHRNQFSPKSQDGLCPYHTFTTQFDQEILAQDLCDPEELARLRSVMDQQLAHSKAVVTKLANRLQRKLMAQQLRSWDFDLEEGILDAGRLARIISNPTHSLSFKQENDTDFRDTVVSLLIDNSGSMRGRPISVAAQAADILARTLERCGVKVEVLGFTTQAWKGGKSRELWLAQGKPAQPGRLNDLRHIVYKPADAPWRRSRTALGLMLKEGILKENIDGEALLWAHQRLLARREQRRILMVISDGAPVDDSTLSANPGNYLEKHLRDVIQWIETRSPIQLMAIGIGHDVTRYYASAVTISDAEELGGTVLRQLTDLFDDSRSLAR